MSSRAHPEGSCLIVLAVCLPNLLILQHVRGPLSACKCRLQHLKDQPFGLQGTYYGDNSWAGSCAGNVGGYFPGTWPPAGDYLTSLQPGNSTPVNVALNGPMYSTAMCGKLLYVKVTH